MNNGQGITNAAEAYPEKGYRAYSVLLGAWFALFPASGLLNSTGTLQAYLAQHQLHGQPEHTVAWIFSIFAFLFFFGGLQIGPLFDKYGLRILLPCGSIGIVVSLVITSFCSTFYQFSLAFGILGGVSSSILWTISIAVIGQWFKERRGLATGLASTAGGCGGVVYPLAFNYLTRLLSFAWAIRVIALISLCCLALSICILKTRLPSNKQARLSLDWRGLRDLRFVLTMLAIFVIDWAVMVPPAYLTSFATFHGMRGISPHILAILNSASIFGRAIPGPVADRFGRFNVMICSAALCSASIFGLWLNASSPAALVAFALLYGLFSGSAYSLTPVCVAQLCRIEEYASKYGTAYGFVSFATLAGVPLSGIILDTDEGQNYKALVLFCGAAYTTATCIFVAARVVSQGWHITTIF